MSAIIAQLKMYQEVAQNSAEWNDLVSAEEIADKTKKSIPHVKQLLADNGITPIGKFGKSYLYSKKAFLELIKKSV